MNRRIWFATLFATLSLGPNLAAWAGTETPVAPEVSPPGDIPDSQVFITYKSPAGFSIKVPESWARKDNGTTTSFSNKYDLVTIISSDLATPLDMNSAKQTLALDLEKGRAVKITKISEANLKAGKTIKIAYSENSEPNAVTNKQIRMESERFYFTKNGKLVTLYLSAPLGADNVDQWQLMSNSFRWN
jgi:hypothetical protein